MWRSATTSKSTKNYADNIVTQHRINNPNLPPTTMILGKETQIKKQEKMMLSNAMNEKKSAQTMNGAFIEQI